MPRRRRTTETTDAFSEFLAEHPGLWPQSPPRADAADPFSEFATEVEPGDDRWLAIARGHKTTPRVHDYRHMLAVASVVLSVFTPAGVISTFIVGRELAVSPLALPPLPGRVFDASVDRLIGVPVVTLPSPPALSAESRLTAPPPLPRPPQPSAALVASPAPASIAVLPLTTALLSSTSGADVKLAAAPPPGRSNPPPASSGAPVVTSPPLLPAPPASSASPELAPPRAPAAGAATETAAVRLALDRYRNAFSTLDASSAKAVWPAVDERTLARAFSQMTEQQFVFDGCNIEVSGGRATASCRGRALYVPKVGSRTLRIEARQWTFTLRRDQQDWAIESVDSR